MATKKKLVKRLRKIAEQLPEIHSQSHYKEIVTGKQLIKEGNKSKDIDPNKKYVRRVEILIPVNHTRRMKNLTKKYGIAGVNSYIAAVGDLKTNVV